MRRSLTHLAVLFLCSVASAQTPNPGTPPPVKPPKCPDIPQVVEGPLGDVDRIFIPSYCAFEADVLRHQPPYIVVSGSNLILHWRAENNKEPDKQRGSPDTYHALKDVAHVPFSLYLLLSPVEKGFVTIDTKRTALTTLKDRINGAESSLDPRYFSTDQIGRQKQILDASTSLIVQTLETGSISRNTLLAFAKNMGPLMAQNAWDAGCEQIKTTHAQMMKWKKQLTSDDWAKLVVVNRARHQARYRNAATQYFHWLFGDESPAWSYPGESMRVIYVEYLAKEEDASDVLATIVVDSDASEAFFANRWRLSEDILSEGAAACIVKLPEGDRVY